MPLPLRLFEPRYLKMLGDLLEQPDPTFGVVLIERGHEVGGGDQRFSVGTLAQVIEVEAQEDSMVLMGRGTSRFRVVEWLAEDPYPQAQVEMLPELSWDPGLQPMRDTAEAALRRALAMNSEFAESWPADVKLSDDPLASCWQLAAITPVTALDQMAMLQTPQLAALLTMVHDFSNELSETLSMGWPDASQ
jgi:Lon protease-like protein